MKVVDCAKMVVLMFAGVAVGILPAENIVMQDSDSRGKSSLNSAGHWASGEAPTAGNSYFTAGKNLRLNDACEGVTFQGDVLYISGGTLVFQGFTSVTIPDLRVSSNNGSGYGNLSSWNEEYSTFNPELRHKLYGKLTFLGSNEGAGHSTGPSNGSEKWRGISIYSDVHGAEDASFRTSPRNSTGSDPGSGWFVATTWMGDLSDYAGWFTAGGLPSKGYYGVTVFGTSTALSTFRGKLRLMELGVLKIQPDAFTDGVATLAGSFFAVDANKTGYLWLPSGTETRFAMDVQNYVDTSAGGTLSLRDTAKVVFKDHLFNLSAFSLTNGVVAFENETVNPSCVISTGRDGVLIADAATFEKGFCLTPDICFLPPEGGLTVDNASEIGSLACVLGDDDNYGRVLTLANNARLAPRVRVAVSLAAEKYTYRPNKDYLLMVVPTTCGTVTADMFETAVLHNGMLPELFADYALETFGRVRVEVDDDGNQRVFLTATGIDWGTASPPRDCSYMNGEYNLSENPLAAGITYIADRNLVSALTIRTPDAPISTFLGERLLLCNQAGMALKCGWLEADIDIVNSASISSWQTTSGQVPQGLRGTLNLLGTPSAAQSLSFSIQNKRDIRVDSEIRGDTRQSILATSWAEPTTDYSRLYLNGLNTNYFGRMRVSTHSTSYPVEQRQCDIVITREENLGGRLPTFTEEAVQLKNYGGLRVEEGNAEIVDPNRGVAVYAGRFTATPRTRLAVTSTTTLKGTTSILEVRGGGTVAVGGTATTTTDAATLSVATGTTFEPLTGCCFTNATVSLATGARVLFNRTACDASCANNGWINLRTFTAEGPLVLAVSGISESALRTACLPLFTIQADDAAALLPKLPTRFDNVDIYRPIYAVEDAEVDGTPLKRIVATFKSIRATVIYIR